MQCIQTAVHSNRMCCNALVYGVSHIAVWSSVLLSAPIQFHCWCLCLTHVSIIVIILLSRRSRQRARLSVSLLSICLSVCLSVAKMQKMRFSQKLSNLELWSLLMTYRKLYMGFSKNQLRDPPKIQDGRDPTPAKSRWRHFFLPRVVRFG